MLSAEPRFVALPRPGCYPRRSAHEPELQRDAQPAENGFSDEGKPRHARAGDAQEMAGSRPLRADPGRARGCGIIRPPRRSALCERRRSHGHRAQQDPERSRGEIENDGGLSRALRARLGLPRTADRIQGRKGIARPFAARSAPEIGSVRAQVRRHPARAIQAARRLSAIGSIRI